MPSDSIFRVPRGQTISADVNRVFQNIRGGRRDTERKWFMERRASSFPVCPRAFHICYRLPPSERPFKDESFASEIATVMGTAMHSVLQKWFGLQDECFWGNWVCLDCKKVRKHKFGPQRCKKCEQEMIYREYALPKKAKLPFTGHIDGLMEMPSGKYLIDFKGSGGAKIQDLKRTLRPYDYHYYQTNAYANAVNMYPKHFGGFGPVDKIIIIYVDRGMANRNWLSLQVPVSKQVFRQCVGLLDEGKESLSSLEVPNGICATPKDKNGRWCPVRDLCFSRLIDAKLKDKVWEEEKASGQPTMLERSVFGH